jgi:hypothetical protein
VGTAIRIQVLFQTHQVISSAVDVIEKDFQDSGKHCNLALSKGKWSNTMWGWAVPKNSPYTEALNAGYIP